MIIEEFISTFYPKDLVTLNIKSKEKELADSYYENAKADAIFAFYSIKNHLSYNIKILEIGGGLHFLSNYLSYKNYQLTSLEPGGFTDYIDMMRNNVLNINLGKKNSIISASLEAYTDNFLKENQMTESYGENIWRIRDLIYSDCYPEIGIIPKKCPEDTHISTHFHEHKMPTIKRLHPAIFLMRPFYFNAKDYFSKGV